jgi:hypothetical protein
MLYLPENLILCIRLLVSNNITDLNRTRGTLEKECFPATAASTTTTAASSSSTTPTGSISARTKSKRSRSDSSTSSTMESLQLDHLLKGLFRYGIKANVFAMKAKLPNKKGSQILDDTAVEITHYSNSGQQVGECIEINARQINKTWRPRASNWWYGS